MMHLGVALLVAASAAPQPPPLKNTTGAREEVRIVVGGSLQSTSPILEYYRGFPPGGVKYITAAGTNPVGDGASIGNFFANAGIEAEWIPVHAPNCEETAFDPEIVAMVEAADAIYMSGGHLEDRCGKLRGPLKRVGPGSALERHEISRTRAALRRVAGAGHRRWVGRAWLEVDEERRRLHDLLRGERRLDSHWRWRRRLENHWRCRRRLDSHWRWRKGDGRSESGWRWCCKGWLPQSWCWNGRWPRPQGGVLVRWRLKGATVSRRGWVNLCGGGHGYGRRYGHGHAGIRRSPRRGRLKGGH